MKPEEKFIIDELNQRQIQLNETTYNRLFAYINQLLLMNQVTNLTAITEYPDALVKHLFDSLVILNTPIFQQAHNILDVGSGGGLPGIPLAICCPEKRFTSIEATRKKVEFQNTVSKELLISNHTAIWGRAEELGHDPLYRQQYELVVARALASTDTLAELILPFVKLNGFVCFYKAKDYQSELKTALNAISIMGGKFHSTLEIQLPHDAGVRNIVIIKKEKNTPEKFPRRAGIPQKNPIK
jgi:16S rRNA (guanine527-N7)-methyltransferase